MIIVGDTFIHSVVTMIKCTCVNFIVYDTKDMIGRTFGSNRNKANMYTNKLNMKKQLFTKTSSDHGELINFKLNLISYFARK